VVLKRTQRIGKDEDSLAGSLQFFEEAHWFFEFYQKPRTGNAESIFQNLLWGVLLILESF
jgi:hypothetical protein